MGVVLPVADASETAPAPSRPVKTASSSQRILVVDDEPAIKETTARILRKNGYEVLTAHDGPSAIDVAKFEALDLVITDSLMPGMSGRELAEAIECSHPEVPVLFMSGYSESAIGPMGIVAHGTQLIEKPFAFDELLRRVQAILEASKRS